MIAAINGTEQRLDAVLAELRGLRAAVDELIQALAPPAPPGDSFAGMAPGDPVPVVLQEPEPAPAPTATPKRSPKKKV